uniref:PPPDE domain-containing protein n=1 Tax=Aegilops tauschii subsp. strangulata TaxID=200361 RepID=A0A452YDM7_AEGTS
FAVAGCGCFGGQARGKVAEDEYPVKLHIYDLSRGMARQLSTTVLGKPIDAIWHTGVVVHGKEYYFGGGIQQGRPGRTPYGTPARVEHFGVTHVSKEDFEGFLQEISPRYTPETYNLLSNNCNHFSNEVVKFLVGSTVPSYILDQPKEAMKSPIGALIMPMLQGLETTMKAGAAPQQPPQFVPAPAAASQMQPSTSSTQNEIATDEMVSNDGGIIPPVVVLPTPKGVGQTQPSTNNDQIESRSVTANETGADEMVDSDGGIIPPPAEPAAPAAATQTEPSLNSIELQTVDEGTRMVTPPAVQPAAPAATVAKVTLPAAAASDPLGEAKSRAQEELKQEFAAIMATGTVQAGDAAALAMRRVMERHGLRRAAVPTQQR